MGQKFNIWFYSINQKTSERWWIGCVKNVEVVDEAESKRVHGIYEKKRWLQSMEDDCRAAGVVKVRPPFPPKTFAVIRFKVSDVDLLDSPLRFRSSDPVVPSAYYSTLLFKSRDPHFVGDIYGKFAFKPGHRTKSNGAVASYEAHEKKIDLVQNSMVEHIYRQLIGVHGKRNVATEQPTGAGTRIDVAVRRPQGDFMFYEVKSGGSLRGCIREAIGQLLEYGFYPSPRRVYRLVVVSNKRVTGDVRRYLCLLRKRLALPIYCQRFNPASDILEETMY